MKHPEPPSSRPIVIRQAWMLVLEDGSHHDMGYSFHLKEEDRVAYISQVLAIHEPSFQAEPIGDPEWISVTEEQHKLIQATPHGLRVG
jgi:hypothetical protein